MALHFVLVQLVLTYVTQLLTYIFHDYVQQHPECLKQADNTNKNYADPELIQTHQIMHLLQFEDGTFVASFIN
jgi:hypothetical protein